MNRQLNSLVLGVPLEQKADTCIIFLHGLGADGYQFESLPMLLDATSLGNARFIFPHAPKRAVSVNHGLPANSWFDFQAITDEEDERLLNMNELSESVQGVHRILNHQISSEVPSKRIVLGGFSQGGVVAYHAAMTYTKPLASVVALSSFLPMASRINLQEASKATPFYIAHGAADDIVPSFLAQSAVATLTALGYSAKIKEYPGVGHDANTRRILSDLSDYLSVQLGGDKENK